VFQLSDGRGKTSHSIHTFKFHPDVGGRPLFEKIFTARDVVRVPDARRQADNRDSDIWKKLSKHSAHPEAEQCGWLSSNKNACHLGRSCRRSLIPRLLADKEPQKKPRAWQAGHPQSR
jgi:hypothetical protein